MKDIKTLLRKKKRRTGKEAAILIIADNFEYFSKSNRILTDADRRAIVKSLNSIKNIKDFETYTSIANHIQETMSSAKSIIAKTEATINEILTEVAELKWIDITRRAESLTPQIMTQKQYEDMKKLQREMKLRDSTSYLCNCLASKGLISRLQLSKRTRREHRQRLFRSL